MTEQSVTAIYLSKRSLDGTFANASASLDGLEDSRALVDTLKSCE